MEAISVFGPKYGSQFYFPSRTNFYSVSRPSCSPQKLFPGKHTKLVCMKATTTATCDDKKNDRKFKKLPPSQWGHHFLSAQVDVSEMNALAREIETLKPRVKNMFTSSKDVEATKQRILFIYLLLSLGVAYHFENEIEGSLKDSFEYIEEMMCGEDDLNKTSIIFWLFRTYGYNVSSDLFKRFTEENGKFKESLIGDVKGMVSLYEAAHLRTTTENIMDEALSFTTSNLVLIDADRACPPHISMRIRNAFCMPQHYNAEMVFAKEYISFYEQEEGHNEMLLRFSKINFKFLQLSWIQELKILTKWWKQEDLASKLLPYFRDRLIETYLFAFMIYFEPKFSLGRTENAKLSTLFTIIDDTCDRYGSITEVAALVHCVERWVPDCVDCLPDHIKPVYKLALDTFDGCEKAGRSEEGLSYNVQGALEEFKIYVRACLCFTEWVQGDVVPTFDEYLEIGGVEVTMYVAIACSYLGLGQTAREKGYEWLKSRPKFVQAQAKKARLMNDITGYEDDMSRGQVANAINYYMKQYGATEEEAFVDLKKMATDLDKTVNEELLKTTNKVPREILKRAVDYGKMIDFVYRSGEEFTHPEGRFKDHITSMFVNLIRL